MAITRGSLVILTLGLAVLAACKSSTATKGAFDGGWLGGDTTAMLALSLSDVDGTVKGSGVLSGSAITGGDIPFTVTGDDNAGTLTSTLHANGFLNVTLGGTVVTADTVDATLNGSGFSNALFVLHRH